MLTHFNFTQELNQHYHLIQKAFDLAKKMGIDTLEVGVGKQVGFSVTVRLGEVETIEHHCDKGLDISVYVNKARGTASTTDMSLESLKETIQAAYRIAKFAEPDPYAGLADPALLAFDFPDLDLYHPWDISIEQAVQMAKAYEQDGLAVAKQITNSEGIIINTYLGIHGYGNSHGFIGCYPTSRHSISCSLIAEDGHEMQREYEYTVACDPALLMPGQQVARLAAEKAVERLAARRLATCKVPVIFSARVAKGLLNAFIGAIAGSRLYRRASFLQDQLGQPIFPSFISIQEQPHLPKALGSAPFDQEGVKTQYHQFVKEGLLQSYVLDSYSARKLGLTTTGNAGGVHNLSITTQVPSLDDLVRKIGKGLLITELMGQGVNLVTGDYSRGAAGFWIEQGKIQYPVHEITVAGNLREMFSNIIAVANDVDDRGNIHSGSILLERMTVAGY